MKENTKQETAIINFDFPNNDFQIEEEFEFAQKINKIMTGGIEFHEELGEKIIYYYEWKGGFFRRRLEGFWAITNYRVISLKLNEDELIQIPLKYVDIAVTDSHNISQSNSVGYGVGLPGSIALGMGAISRKGVSIRIGNLNFIFNGGIVMQFQNIPDPTGIKQLVYAVKKQMYHKK